MPAQKPTALKIIEGTKRKDRSNPKEPKADTVVLTAPDSLTEKGQEKFKELAEELAKVKVSTRLDRDALTMLVEAWQEYWEASAVIRDSGIVFTTTNTNGHKTIKNNPAVAVRADAWRRIKVMMTEFGLTPASRAKVNAEDESDTDDPLEKYGV